MAEVDMKVAPRWNRTILIVAVVLAVVAVVLVNVYLKDQEDRQKRGYLSVVEVTRRLDKGQALTKADVREASIPPVDPLVAEKMVKSNELPGILEGNRPLARTVEKGDRLLWTHFTSETGEGGGPEPPTGFVWVSLPLDRKTNPGMLIRQGMYVKVYATMPAGANQAAKTSLVLDRALVAAINGRTAYDPQDPRSQSAVMLQFQVTPPQAEKLYTINYYLKDGFTVAPMNSQDKGQDNDKVLDDAVRKLNLGPLPAGPPE
jgi:Flp pilus assembly protein CpaB